MEKKIRKRGQLDNPIIAFPIKINSSFPDIVALSELFSDFNYVALEVTLTNSRLSRIKSYLNEISRKLNDKPIYLRFHTLVKQEYDIFEDNERTFLNLNCLIDFISNNYGGGYLVLHSVKEPNETTIQSVSEFVAQAKKKGVVLALENLRRGWSSDIILMKKTLAETGLKAVLDIGHLNSSDYIRFGRIEKHLAVELLSPYLVGAHIYEHEDNGHIPIEDFFSIGEVLKSLYESDINWWVVELENISEFQKTLRLVQSFIDSLKTR
ncbi:MAG: sugar phosphate isomerase/epimerase [Actinobacteria bacterium]|nr:sugar phosphate isomerase/epimerase [Actinomycetota bacterium]